MKDQLRKFFFVIAYAILLLGSVNSHAVSLECSFAYNDDTYEWVRADEFSTFRYINDSGQAVISSRALRVSAFEPSIVLVSFLDNDTFNERQHDIVASYDFDREYHDLIEFQILGFNNAGEVYGDIYLITGTDADGNNLPGGFPPNSARFAFVWDKTNGFRDLADIVPGLTGRTDIGSETGIAIDYINGHGFYVRHYAPPAAEGGVPFPFELLEPQDRSIPVDMLDAIKNQCGDSPYILALVNDAAQSSRFNNNLEFIHGPHLVRKARPNIDIGIGHVWRTNSGEFISPPRAAHLPGKVGERLTFGIGIKNSGAVDITNLQVSAKIIDSSPAGVLKFNGTDYNGTFFKAGIDEGLPTALASFDRINVEKLHTTVKPGTVTFEVVVTGNDPNGNAVEFKKTDKITVESTTPELIAALSFTDGRISSIIKKDEQFGVTLNIATTDGEGSIDNILFSNLFAGASNLEVITSPAISSSGYSLEPGQSLPPFNWVMKAKTTGAWQLATTVSGTDMDSVSKSDSAKLSGSVGDQLEVTFNVTPSSLVLNEPDREGNAPSARCKQLQDGVQDKNNPITNCVEVIATITNTGDTSLTNVNVQGLTEGLHKGLTISSLTQDLGVPMTFIELEPAAGTAEMPQAVDLGVGESTTVTWRLNVFDAPATVRFRTLVTGSDAGKNVTALGESEYKIISNVLAEVRIKASRIGSNVLENGEALQGPAGSAVHIGGNVKNTSKDVTLEIQFQEVITGNAGHGILYSPIKWGRSRTPDARQPFRLEPGEEVNLLAILRTIRAIAAADASAEYFVKAFSLETNEDGSVTKRDVSDQVKFIKEKGFVNPVVVRMLPNPPEEFDPIDECGSWYFTCGVTLGVENLALGLWDTSKFLGNTLVDFGNQELMLLSWMGEMTVVGMKATLGDEVARAALVSEIAVDLQALIDTGAITIGQGVSVTKAIGQAMEDGVGAFGEAITTGDLERVQFQFGRFIGENPDLLPFDRLVMKMATSKVMSRVSGVNGASKITGEAIEELAKKSDDIIEVSARYDAALAKNKDIDITRDVAETGDLVAKVELDAAGKPKLDADGKPIGNAGPIPKFWGASADDVLKVLAIAVDEKVLISFRSRAIEAITLVKNKLAWPKPGAYGVKGTTEIDLRYLDYPNNRLLPDGVTIDARFPTTKGTTDLVEPPSQLIGKQKGLELEAALDLYMENVMKKRHPELATDIELAGQVRNRLKTRAEEWPKYLEKFEDWKINGVDLSFGANKQGIWEIFRKPIVDNRQVRIKERTITTPHGDKRKVFQFDMAGPSGTDFRAITGDIDFLAILNANGTMLLNPFKRLRIYDKLQKAVGMQHGESFTFALNQALRAEWLRCCARRVAAAGKKAEKMITAQPNGKARVSEFVENKSLTIDSPNSAKRLDKSGDFILLSGAEYALKARKGLVNRLKFRDLSDSITDLIGAGARVVYSLNILRRIIPGLNDESAPTQFNRDTDTTIVIPDRKGGLLAWIPGFGFEPVQLVNTTTANTLLLHQVLAAIKVDPASIEGVALFDGDGRLKLLPQTALGADTEAGSDRITIATPEEMGVGNSSPWFEVGDTVVINPGEINQEIRTIEKFGSLVFTEPLVFSHGAGELVSVVFDPDNDGETNITDVFPNDPAEAFDTDSDGIGNNADPDDDNDGTPDADEVRFGSDPLNNLDTPEQHRPVKPILSSMLPDTVKPLTHFDLGISAFSDPDESGDATEVEVTVEGQIDGGVGTVFNRRTRGDELPALELPAGTLDTGSDYTMSVRYFDASGQASDASDVFAFTTETQDPADLNDNRIEDVAEVTADMDINKNNIDDASEGITVILNAENGDALGISVDKGTLSDVSVLSEADIPDGMVPAKVTDLPLGMTGFRVSNLTPGDEVTVTFHLLSSLPANKAWYQYDSLSEALVDITGQAVFNSDGTVSVKYVDGGVGDLDGVANGRIIDPSGPAAVTVKKNNTSGNSGGGGGGGAYNLTALVLLTLALFMLRRLRAGKSH